MKKYILTLYSLLLICMSLQAQNSNAVINSFEYSSDSVYLDFTLDIQNIDISSNETVVFTPTILNSRGDSLAMPTIVVRGRNSVKQYNRNLALNNNKRIKEYEDLYKTPYIVVNQYGATAQSSVEYKASIPYQVWMAESELSLDVVSFGCCNITPEDAIEPSDNLLAIEDIASVEELTINPVAAFIRPEPVAVKRRDIEYSSALVFSVGSSEIKPELANNLSELSSINNMMESILTDKDFTVTAVNITGYASPEGTIKSNQLLSERRAKALENILVAKYDVSRSLYRVNFGGENWDGLIPMVEQSDLDDRDEIIELIQNVSIDDDREGKLIRLNGGSSYRYMLKNFFPAVRLVVINVEYNVDAYNLERIKELINLKPENLSLEEMYRLSETYEDINSEEVAKIFAIAQRQYPDDEVAIHNALVSEILSQDLEGASEYINRIDHKHKSAEVINTLGAYYMLSGEYDKAEPLLERAVELGSENGEQNLSQLRAKIKNIEAIEQSQLLRAKIYGE